MGAESDAGAEESADKWSNRLPTALQKLHRDPVYSRRRVGAAYGACADLFVRDMIVTGDSVSARRIEWR